MDSSLLDLAITPQMARARLAALREELSALVSKTHTQMHQPEINAITAEIAATPRLLSTALRSSFTANTLMKCASVR